jgi:O-antigen biosynthesis protein
MKPSGATPIELAKPADCPAPAQRSTDTRAQALYRQWIRVRRQLARAIAREGASALAIRKTCQAIERVKERATIGWYARRQWKSDGSPVFLFISHRCGGGTEQHLRHLVVELGREGVRVVVVRPSRAGFLLWEERDDHQNVIWCRESSHQRASLEKLLRLIGPVHAHVHHTLGVPLSLVDLLADHGISYDWTIHDYYTICPRVNLVNAESTYCGEPHELGCNQCLARNGNDQGQPVPISIEGWRQHNANHLGRARRVIVPSADVRDRIDRYFPDLSVILRPHPETLPDLRSLAPSLAPDEPARIAVVGTITAIKGSERLLACARDARARELPLEFHVIGSTDQDAVFAGLGNVRVWGRYKEREVYARLAAVRCHVAFLPSLWPETFMYTLSAVMASGLYTICFDLGAQSSRLHRWGWGQVLPLNTDPAVINEALLEAARKVAADLPAPSPPPPAHYHDILRSYYGFSPEERDRFFLRPARAALPKGAKPFFMRRRKDARIH